MTKTQWFRGNQYPVRDGLYERDWTNTNIHPAEDRKIYLDLWVCEWNLNSICYPGVWYVIDERGPNDASAQNLPWRGVVK